MKKFYISVLICFTAFLAVALTACGGKGGTYYPPEHTMKTNLEKKGYAVTVYQDLSDNTGKRYDGTLLFASKSREGEKEEYLYFYRLEQADACEYYYNAMEKDCTGYDSLVKIENDEKFGNIVYCGTENAINAAGIRVVDVKVKI